MIKGNCHCGAISFELDDRPEWLTQCNCSICRRLGTVWAHAPVDKVTLNADSGASIAYSWGANFFLPTNTGAILACRPVG